MGLALTPSPSPRGERGAGSPSKSLSQLGRGIEGEGQAERIFENTEMRY
jgi:hypothetical protein